MANADVNAACNIAAASLRNASGEYLAHWEHEPPRIGKKDLRRQIRSLLDPVLPAPVATEITSCDNLLAVLE